MADVHNVKHINQLDVTFSTEMKDRHSFIIAAVFFFFFFFFLCVFFGVLVFYFVSPYYILP